MGVPAAKLKQIKRTRLRDSDGFLQSRAYINFLAQTHPELRLKREGTFPSYVAQLPFYEPLRPGRLRELLRGCAHRWPHWFAPSTLFIGSPFEPYEQSSQLGGDIDEGMGDLAHRAQKEGCGLMVLTNVSSSDVALQTWRQQGFKAMPSLPDMVLTLCGAHFDDYLNSRKSKVRNSIARNIRKFEEAGFEICRFKGPELRALSHHLVRSYHQMYARANIKWLRHTAAYFEHLCDFEEDVFVDIAVNASGHLMGFIVSFDDGNRLHGGRIGVIPRQHQKNAVYFRLIYSLIERAYDLKKREVVLEPTSFKMKRYLGAEYRPLVNLIRGTNVFWRTVCFLGGGLGRYWLRYLERRDQLEEYY